jgi:hypothetical protein
MKKSLKNVSKIFISIALFSTLIGLKPLSDDTPVALVKKVVRDVNQRADKDSDWQLAAKGEPLYDGGEVKTGSNSLALVLFTDGSGLLRIRENSIANIYGTRTRQEFSNNTTIHKGSVGFDVNKQRENEEFTFTTPTMVASIRGTSGLILVEDVGSSGGTDNSEVVFKSTLIVEEGEIEVESTNGERNKALVSAGQSLESDDSGQLVVEAMSEKQTKVLKSSKATKLKKVRFTLDGVEYEVEYYSTETEEE